MHGQQLAHGYLALQGRYSPSGGHPQACMQRVSSVGQAAASPVGARMCWRLRHGTRARTRHRGETEASRTRTCTHTRAQTATCARAPPPRSERHAVGVPRAGSTRTCARNTRRRVGQSAAAGHRDVRGRGLAAGQQAFARRLPVTLPAAPHRVRRVPRRESLDWRGPRAVARLRPPVQ